MLSHPRKKLIFYFHLDAFSLTEVLQCHLKNEFDQQTNSLILFQYYNNLLDMNFNMKIIITFILFYFCPILNLNYIISELLFLKIKI